MNNWQSEGYTPSLTDCACAFLLSGNFSFDAACANEVSASKLNFDKKSRFFLNEESGDYVSLIDREIQKMDCRGFLFLNSNTGEKNGYN